MARIITRVQASISVLATTVIGTITIGADITDGTGGIATPIGTTGV
jgi:hypothetical protein